jgi:hypothetical protein
MTVYSWPCRTRAFAYDQAFEASKTGWTNIHVARIPDNTNRRFDAYSGSYVVIGTPPEKLSK